MGKLPQKAQQALQAALRKARKWRRPPHWDGYEWQKELDAIAQASAFEASLRFDGRKDVPLEVFVFQQVLTALRNFHRKEWIYFRFHYGHLSLTFEGGEGEGEKEGCFEGAVRMEGEGEKQEWRRFWVRWGMEKLGERERWVLLKFYWEGWTEEEIAQELGISQQAVSKVKQRALQKLKELLSGLL